MKKSIIYGISVSLLLGFGIFGFTFFAKYHTSQTMTIPVEEINSSEYPEDPSDRSIYYGRYGMRRLILIQKDAATFDFVFASDDPMCATIAFKDIDLSLYIPILPQWTKNNPDLETIALVDREWNRQQVTFTQNSHHLEITDGDNFEKSEIVSAELARNCLNAGLWELLLYTRENGKKTLFYQGWFNFPLGHYKQLFETYNASSYWKHWHHLEHWINPEGTPVPLDSLRTVLREEKTATIRQLDERIIASGEQLRKVRTFEGKDIRCWGDFCKINKVQYASFIPPGRYSIKHPWSHEYERISDLKSTNVRKIHSPAQNKALHEIELEFISSKTGKLQRFIVSGVDLNSLPQLPINQYPKGLYMPMGIGVPPFYQSYEQLKQSRPYEQGYFSVLLNEEGEWINHHEVAIDGPVMHRDMEDPNLIHLYLLSYERHSLVGHFVIPIPKGILD